MDKVKLELVVPKNIRITYNSKDIEINPYLDFAKQAVLISNYINDFFGDLGEIIIPETKHHVFEAECRLINYIYRLNTNIDFEEINNEIYVDDFLWTTIKSKIINYDSFRKRLDSAVAQVQHEEDLSYSVGKVISDLIIRANEAIDKFTSMNPEEIKKMGESGLELIDRLEKSSVLKNPNDFAEIAAPVIEEKKDEPTG